MNLLQIAEMTEDAARSHLEGLRWPNGPVCPRCGEAERIYRLKGKSTRAGLLKCGCCRKPFTVRVGTVMESSHISIKKWLVAFHLVTSSKKGTSAHQLHRSLKISYKAAWFLYHRIRYAMEQDPKSASPLSGDIEADETFVGGKPRSPQNTVRRFGRRGHAHKTPVAVLIQRDGEARTKTLKKVDSATMHELIEGNVDLERSRLITDEGGEFKAVGRHFAKGHETVRHGVREYARGDVTTNTAESFFALVKRSHYGIHHHYSREHTHRYITEREFMWNARKMDDSERRDTALRGIEGKRLTYRPAKRRWPLTASSGQ